MKKIFILAMAISFTMSCEKLPETDSSLGSGNPSHQVAFLENKFISDVKVKNNQSTEDIEIRARIANPMNEDSYYRISLDDAFIREYNQKNNSDYESLPSNNIEMSYTLNGKTQTGTSMDLLVLKGKVEPEGKLTIKIKSMEDASGEELPLVNSYALAVKMTPTDSRTIQQGDKKNAMFIVRRSFKTKVAQISGRAFHMIYGKDTGAQVAGKEYDKEVKLEEWTMQYSFAIKTMNDNWGLMYENPRNSTASKLWNTVQGDRKFMLRYGAAAVLKFETPAGKDFQYQVAGNNPTADKWHHMAMVYKNVEGRPRLYIYVNGELMFDSPSPVIVNDFPLVCFGNGRTDGYVREIRFWSKALTQGQVASTQYFVKPDSDGLELYVPFNEQPWEEIDQTYEDAPHRKMRVIKNASTNPNKKMPEKWYLHYNGREWRYPDTNFDTEVEF